jgi:hypothetical protein
MPLDVLGPPSVQSTILKYLQLICPCVEITLVQGVVQLGNRRSCCCGHGIGCTLISSLVDTAACGQHIKIETVDVQNPKDPCNSIYDYDVRTVFLCPYQRLPSCCTWPSAGPAVTLAHELAHALIRCDVGAAAATEDHAQCVENQIRFELNLPPRCRDDGKRISSSCEGLTSTWSSSGCGCVGQTYCLISSVAHAISYRVKYSRPCLPWLKLRPVTMMDRNTDSSKPFASSDLAQRVAEALEWRDKDPNAHAIDRILREAGSSADPPEVFMLEQVVIGLPYLVTLVLVYEGRLEVITNWTRPGGPWPPERPGLVRLLYGGDNMPLMPVGAFDAPPGFGGRASIEDAALDTLTVGVAGDLPERPVRLYGVTGRSPSSDEDRERWEAIGEFKRLRDVLLHEGRPDSVEVLRSDEGP